MPRVHLPLPEDRAARLRHHPDPVRPGREVRGAEEPQALPLELPRRGGVPRGGHQPDLRRPACAPSSRAGSRWSATSTCAAASTRSSPPGTARSPSSSARPGTAIPALVPPTRDGADRPHYSSVGSASHSRYYHALRGREPTDRQRFLGAATARRHDARRALRADGSPRHRRDGGGLPRAPRPAAKGRRRQGDASRPDRGEGSRRAVPAGGRDRCTARGREHRASHRLRAKPGGLPVPRHGAAGGGEPLRAAPPRGALAARGGGPHLLADSARPSRPRTRSASSTATSSRRTSSSRAWPMAARR